MGLIVLAVFVGVSLVAGLARRYLLAVGKNKPVKTRFVGMRVAFLGGALIASTLLLT